MTKTMHDLGQGWKAQLTLDGGMIVFDTKDTQQIIVPPDSVATLRGILNKGKAHV